MARSERFAARRAEILRSAAIAFRKRGFHGATVEEIARALRMRKGNLYYYFENKEQILFFCHDYSLDMLLAMLAEVQQQRAPVPDRLRDLIGRFVHVILDELHGTALTLDVQALSPNLLRRVVEKRDRFDRGVRELIEEGIRLGELAPGDPKLLSFAMLGAVNWINRWFDPDGPARSDEIAATFADYLVSGLLPRDGQASKSA